MQNKLKVLVGCEESQAVTIELRKKGHEAYSCDFLDCSGCHPEWHIKADVKTVLNGGKFKLQSGEYVIIEEWDAGIFFPDCTFLTCSAEWAYKDGPYHQKLKPGTLSGLSRRNARVEAIDFVKKIYNCKIPKVAIENPKGVLSTKFMKPSQIVQPYEYGDDASKGTCLWLRGFNELVPTEYIEPRYIDGRPRWSNQTDSGQNNLPPSKERAKLRSKTYKGIAEAIASQWFENVHNSNKMQNKTLKEELELLVNYYAKEGEQDQLTSAIKTLIERHGK